VEWVNEVFAQVLPATEDIAAGAVTYAPSIASTPSTSGAGVEVHALIGDEGSNEPALARDLILQAQADDPDGTIALLVRARTQLARIVPVLKEAGIAFRAIETEALQERPVVRDLHALARAMVHPADRTAWLAILRAPWCGLSLRDLEILASDGPQVKPEDRDAFDRTLLQLMQDAARVARMSEDGQVRLARLRAALDPVLAARGRGSLRRRVEGAWMRLGGPACAEDAVDVEDGLVFLRLLDELERGGDIEDLRALDERLEGLFALPDLHASDRLQLMTIHKSKGLEFDSVIVAGLGRRARADDPQLLNWLERPGEGDEPDLLLAAITEKGEDTDPIYQCVTRLHQQRQREEDSRLLYVAVTRARRRAHLIGCTGLDAHSGLAKRPAAGSLLERLWPALAPQFDAAARRAKAEHDGAAQSMPAPASMPQTLRRLRIDWRLPQTPASAAWRAPAPVAAEELLPEIEFSWAGETARHVGTVVHRFLQQMAQEGLERWGTQRLEKAFAIAEVALRAQGVPAVELEQACERVQRALRGILEDSRAHWVLASAHVDAQAELRLTARLDDELVQVAVDRTFVDEHGTRWIIDYKTGLHEGGDREGFLDREQERYRQQLERYAAVLRKLDGRPVKVALYFPLLQAWREWVPGS
jgi:ATP-dependent exoDNAse (exonuclease V) beta subunit